MLSVNALSLDASCFAIASLVCMSVHLTMALSDATHWPLAYK